MSDLRPRHAPKATRKRKLKAATRPYAAGGNAENRRSRIAMRGMTAIERERGNTTGPANRRE